MNVQLLYARQLGLLHRFAVGYRVQSTFRPKFEANLTHLIMVVAACTIQIQLYGIHSIKDKRSIVRYLTKRLPKQFNVAAAEIDDQDIWQSSIIALVGVGNDHRHLHSMMEKAVTWIETNRPDIEIVDYAIEFR